MTPSHARLLFGTDEPIPASTALRAGPLTLTLRAGRLWDIALGDVEVWHGVAFLYRDPDWGTPEPVIERCRWTLSSRAFSIRCTGRFPTSPIIDFRLDLVGTVRGTVRITGEAVPRGDIATNRLGLCVMHPMAAAGRRVEVTHIDGRVSRSTFPALVPPWPPFTLVRAIRHEYARGRWARCRFEGDDFEVEDQRNNSDASFKTYSRSNMMPRPYRLRAGIPVVQSVELSLDTPRLPARRSRDAPVVVDIGRHVGKLPGVGIEIGRGDALADAATRAAVRALRPAHLHVALTDEDERGDWHTVGDALRSAQASLRLDVAAADAASLGRYLHDLRTDLAAARVVPASLAVFPSDTRCVDAARNAFPRTLIGGGTPHFFVQLNRAEGIGAVDFLTFTTCPIVHGADDESVIQTLRSLPSMVATLNARHPGMRIRIGPSTIAARRSPLGNQPRSDGTQRIALARADPRCRGLYGAAWALGYAARLAACGGVDAVTLMQLLGPSGVLRQSAEGVLERFPAYHALASLRGGAKAVAVRVSQPSRVAALMVPGDGRPELVLANLGGDPIDVDVRRGGALRYAAVMDAASCPTAPGAGEAWQWKWRRTTRAHITLDAYAVARLKEDA